VPHTALPALRVFYVTSVSPCGGHRYACAAGLTRPPGWLRHRGGRVFKGCSCKGGGPENALQPPHARPLQEFLRNNARSALQCPSLPPSAGETFAAWTREWSAHSAFLLRSWDPPPAAPSQGRSTQKRDPRSTVAAGRPASPGSGDPPGDISKTKRAGEGVISVGSPIGAEDRRCAGVRRSTTEKEAGDAPSGMKKILTQLLQFPT